MNILEISIERDSACGFMVVCKTPLRVATMGAESLPSALEKLPLVAENALKITVGEGGKKGKPKPK